MATATVLVTCPLRCIYHLVSCLLLREPCLQLDGLEQLLVPQTLLVVLGIAVLLYDLLADRLVGAVLALEAAEDREDWLWWGPI